MCPKWGVCVKSPTKLIRGLKGGLKMDKEQAIGYMIKLFLYNILL